MATTRQNRVRRAYDWEDDNVVISDSTRIDGQRVVIAFFHSDNYDAPNTWYTAFLVGATRAAKKDLRRRATWDDAAYSGKSTGRSGLKALMWAARKIDEFQTRVPEAYVVVGAHDERRASAYTWLERRGFRSGYYRDERVLYRTPDDFAAYKLTTRRNSRRRRHG